MLSPAARSNLQVKLIDDARKLLEQVQSQDVNKSFDSSFSSFCSGILVQKQEQSSPSKFNDIMFVQKSVSEQEEADDDSVSIGNLSYSRSERDDEFLSEIDMSAIIVNSPYRVTHIDQQMWMQTSNSPMPQLAAASFGSDLVKKADTETSGSGSGENKAESRDDSSVEIRELLEHRLENAKDISVCSANSTDNAGDSYGSRMEEKDGNKSCRHSSAQTRSRVLDEVDSIYSGRSDDVEGDQRGVDTSVCGLKSLKAENMLSSARNLIASYTSRTKSFESKGADSSSSASSKSNQIEKGSTKEHKIGASDDIFASETTLKIEGTLISQSDQGANDIKNIDQLLRGKNIEAISASSNGPTKPSATEVGQSTELSASEVKRSEVVESIQSIEANSVSPSSEKSSASPCDGNVQVDGIMPIEAKSVSSMSQKSSTEKSVENFEANSVGLKSHRPSSAVSIESAKLDSVSSSSQKPPSSIINAITENIETNSVSSRSQKSSSADSVEAARGKSVLSRSQNSSSADSTASAKSVVRANSVSSRSQKSSFDDGAKSVKVKSTSSRSQESSSDDGAKSVKVKSILSNSQESSSDDGADSVRAKSLSPCSQKSSSTNGAESVKLKSVSPCSQKFSTVDSIESTKARSISSRSQKSFSDDGAESVKVKSISSRSQKSSSVDSIESAKARSISSRSQKSSSVGSIEPVKARSISSRSQKSFSVDSIEPAIAQSVSSRVQKSSSVGSIEFARAKSVSPRSQKSSLVYSVDSAESIDSARAKSISPRSQKYTSADSMESAKAESVSLRSQELSSAESIETAKAKSVSSRSKMSSSGANSVSPPSSNRSAFLSTSKRVEQSKVTQQEHRIVTLEDDAKMASPKISTKKSEYGVMNETGSIISIVDQTTANERNTSSDNSIVSKNNEGVPCTQSIEVRSTATNEQKSTNAKISELNKTEKVLIANADLPRSVSSEKMDSNSITITRKSKKTMSVVEMNIAGNNAQIEELEYDDTSQIVELQEKNKRLLLENTWLQEDMNSFDEKLACLEITLGIIDSVEKKTAKFNVQESAIEKQEQEKNVKHNQNDEEKDYDEYSTLSDDSRLSRKSRKSIFSKSSKSSKDAAAKSSFTWTRRSTGSRRSLISRTLEKSKASNSERSEADENEISSAESEQSHASFHSAASKQSGLTSISKEKAMLDDAESRDEQPESTKNRSTSATSKITTSLVRSMSRKDQNELKMLRENNENMLRAIKALSKATTIQTRKHHHYKCKFGHTRKNLVEGNVKLEEVTSNFYKTRAQFLQEQDKREELSDSVQTLAKKMNDLRRKLQADEENKVCLLDRIDENSVISCISISNSTNASALSRLSAIIELDTTRDSLDEVLSPRSQNTLNVLSPKSESREKAEEDQTKLSLELEVMKLKAKIERRESTIWRLQNKFSIVKGYLKGIEDGKEAQTKSRKSSALLLSGKLKV